jgi:hypothetical protein
MKKYIFLIILSFTLFYCKSRTEVNKTEIKNLSEILGVNLDVNDSAIYIGEIISLKDLKAKSLYQVNCKMCHGESGLGDGIKARLNPNICPHDLTNLNIGSEHEITRNNEIYYIILNGKNYMPAYDQKLGNDKIKLLVVYIKKFKK